MRWEDGSMRGLRERLERDLTLAMNRLRHMGGVALEELPGSSGDNKPFADEVDEIVANEEREIRFGTRELLVDRVNRITAALDRLRSGEYGTCVECGEPIAPARLRVMPEVETCVRCQDRIERLGRHLQRLEVEVGVDED
jgi:DnaK suppressor protein